MMSAVSRITSSQILRLEHQHLFNPKFSPPRQAWLENFDGLKAKKLAILDLHPLVFGVFPRPDHMNEAVIWQKKYREVSYLSMPTRNELPGGTRKPWPQKGQGRARHGSVNSPIFLKGGWARGPRGPKSYYYMPPHHHLVSALQSTFTIKLAQDDLKIVDSLCDSNLENSEDLEDKFAKRGWGPSVLIVDNKTFPQELENASKHLSYVNLMPIVGINVLSIVKHETLVVTEAALREIESKILYHLVRSDFSTFSKPKEKDPGY